MTFLYVLLTVYILSVNFCAFFLIKRQYEAWEAGDTAVGKSDGKVILVALLGGAIAVLASMFIFKYRLSNVLFMIAMPVLSVVNLYCFYLGFRGIYLFL
ncbi:MAG: hypothetical protein K2N74_02980 [Clostridiales bacterium]|nr:hypothetical protein [Clostridiales bacterium]